MYRNNWVILICTGRLCLKWNAFIFKLEAQVISFYRQGAETFGIITKLWIFHRYIIVELFSSTVTGTQSLRERLNHVRVQVLRLGITVATCLCCLAPAASHFHSDLKLSWVFKTEFTSKRVDDIQRKGQTWWFFLFSLKPCLFFKKMYFSIDSETFLSVIWTLGY